MKDRRKAEEQTCALIRDPNIILPDKPFEGLAPIIAPEKLGQREKVVRTA